MTSKEKLYSVKQFVNYVRRFLTPFVVFFVGIFATAIVCMYVYSLARSRDALRFSSVTSLITVTLQDGINSYTQLAGSTASYFSSNTDVTDDEFRKYLRLLMVTHELHGVRSIGFIEYGAISRFFNTHASQLSADLPNEAFVQMSKYLQSEKAQSVFFVGSQNGKGSPYFFFLMPVYYTSGVDGVIAQSQNLRGYVYIFGDETQVVSKIVSNSLDADVLLEIRSESTKAGSLLYKSDKADEAPRSLLFTPLQTTKRVNINGHDFYATYSTKSSFFKESEINLLPYIIMIGTVVTLILYILSLLQQYAWDKAEKTAEELRISERNVRIIEQQKTEFLNIASHELKTPITSLSAYIQLLERKMKSTEDPQVSQYIKRIKEQLSNLTSLINDLLDTTRIESGKMILNKSTFSYPEFIKEVIENMRPIIPNHTVMLAISEEMSITADKFRIAQVLTNLLHNAAKYSPDADIIDVSLCRENNNAIVAVKDYGIGISDYNMGKIFTKFFRASVAKENKVEGLGLGLYISAEIVRKHKGDIWVESHKGKGSVFFFSLPIETSDN